MQKRKLEKGEKGFIAILGVFAVIALIASLRIFVQNPVLNGEGTVPLITSIVLLLMTGIMFLEMRGAQPGFTEKLPAARRAKEIFTFLFPGKVGLIVVYCIIYAILLGIVGFVVSTLAFLIGSMLTLRKTKRVQSAVISVIIVVCIMVLFQYIFKVQLP